MSSFVTHPGTTVYRELDVDTFPASIELRGSKILGTLGVFFGVSFSVLPLVAVGLGIAEEGWSREMIVALAMFVLPFGLFTAVLVWGINQFMMRTTTSLDGHEVRWVRRTWRGTRERTEPLSAFSGIQSVHRFQSEDGDLWELLLQHPDPSLSVLLYRANRPAGLVERWRRYCQVFRQAALESLAPGHTLALPLEDLGRPLLDVLREGGASVPEPGPVPDGVAVEPAADGVAVHIRGRLAFVVGEAGVRVERGRGQTVGVGDIAAVTVDQEHMIRRRFALTVRYRRPLSNGGVLNLSLPLVRKAPLDLLVWVQRFVLRTLAGR
jgi:hypothetical protein